MKITFKDIIEVYYVDRLDENGENPHSLIKPVYGSFLVHTNGVLVNTTSVRLFGYFSQKGLYDMLPFDFTLSK